MKKKKFTLPDKRKYHTQIEELKKMLPKEMDDLQYLDNIPNYTGPDEPIPCPYGVQRGKGPGQRSNKLTRKNR